MKTRRLNIDLLITFDYFVLIYDPLFKDFIRKC